MRNRMERKNKGCGLEGSNIARHSGLVKSVEKSEQGTEMKQYKRGMVRRYLVVIDNVGPEHGVNYME